MLKQKEFVIVSPCSDRGDSGSLKKLRSFEFLTFYFLPFKTLPSRSNTTNLFYGGIKIKRKRRVLVLWQVEDVCSKYCMTLLQVVNPVVGKPSRTTWERITIMSIVQTSLGQLVVQLFLYRSLRRYKLGSLYVFFLYFTNDPLQSLFLLVTHRSISSLALVLGVYSRVLDMYVLLEEKCRSVLIYNVSLPLPWI